MERQKLIRNFSIIAHIDHGKSTLADRIIEYTNTVEKRLMKEQILDTMDLERERGITIKLNAIQLKYLADDGLLYTFNLIDTPGHVDFAYEVSRSLASCQGALLVVDATQGVQAQTLANVYLALDNNLEVLPIINKVDLPSAQPELVKQEIEDLIGLDTSYAPLISAKTGFNIKEVLEGIVKYLPAPVGDENAPLKALIFDSYFDTYRGVVIYISVKEGTVSLHDKIKLFNADKVFEVLELGVRTPNEVLRNELKAGDVGWIAANIKTVKDVTVGDTITSAINPTKEALAGYRHLTPMVFCGLYPTDNARYKDFKEALDKLSLNDSSLIYEPETSQALGFGFRLGFLGLLHMDVVQERLEREFNLGLIATAPSVIYHIFLTNGDIIKIDNPSKLPDPSKIDHIEEPYVLANMFTPEEYIGPLMELSQRKRGIYKDLIFIDSKRRTLVYEIPLSEIIFDFFDKLKSISRGYASLDYALSGYKTSKLLKMDILLNGEEVDALATIVHTDFAFERGQRLTVKLKEVIPQQLFEVPVQAAIGGKIIARTNIKAQRKDVLAKCYGGDITRKKKLLEKQKEGKKRMKLVGSVEVPQEAFMAILKVDDD
jgi:GTP-binding protein LepA